MESKIFAMYMAYLGRAQDLKNYSDFRHYFYKQIGYQPGIKFSLFAQLYPTDEKIMDGVKADFWRLGVK